MLTSRSLLVVALLPILWLPGYARSATYYVAQAAPNASDENPGSEGQPWKTLAHAAKQVQPKDILFVKAGTYRETLHLTTDKVSVRAFGDDAVSLKMLDDRYPQPGHPQGVVAENPVRHNAGNPFRRNIQYRRHIHIDTHPCQFRCGNPGKVHCIRFALHRGVSGKPGKRLP